MDYKSLAQEIKDAQENIFLIYAFNGTGKTQLSVAYKEITKKGEEHTGVYYNAYSEDLFVWDNDEPHDNKDIKLTVVASTINKYHSYMIETEIEANSGNLINPIQKKLKFYNPRYSFRINRYYLDEEKTIIDEEKGIESFSFFSKEDIDQKYPIKISRGEERIFVWCFFLALFDEIAADNDFIFIDDPVSSLDDHNIFVTAFTLFELIKKYYENRKIIITTHHIGFATILGNWLTDGNNPFKGKNGNNKYSLKGLSYDKGKYSFVSFTNKAVWLYHLRMLQVLDKAIQDDADENNDNGIEVYHMAILRQVLENISSFLGVGRIGFVLEEIGYSKEEADKIALEDNALTHRNVYFPQSDIMVPDNKNMLKDVFNRIIKKYHFDYKKIK